VDANDDDRPARSDDSGPGSPPGPEGGAAPWVVDAALGATASFLRLAGGVTRAALASPPARVANDLARTVARPLTEEGRQIREGAARDGAPGLGEAVRDLAPAVVDAIGINGILEQIDVERIIERVDVERIVDRVDVERIVDRVDVGRIVDRVDVDRIVSRVDVNAIVQRVDIDSLMTETELGSIIAQSTSGVASQALDSVRSQGVGLDGFIARWANRLARRDPAELPAGPPLLVDQPRALPPADPA
jgi:hypothetical protein